MKIAIKGDKIRFKEVNAILQYLSGKRVKHKGSCENLYYCLDWYKCIFCYGDFGVKIYNYNVYTVDEFYIKFNTSYSEILQKINHVKFN